MRVLGGGSNWGRARLECGGGRRRWGGMAFGWWKKVVLELQRGVSDSVAADDTDSDAVAVAEMLKE